MRRREFLQSSIAAGAGIRHLRNSDAGAAESRPAQSCSLPFPKTPGLTQYVADFVVRTQLADIPSAVIEIGKKSLLDGMGLALAGSKLPTADILQSYMHLLGFNGTLTTGASVVGTSSKLPPRFAAFANGVAIHVEDFDDTQLAAAKERVYGLLTHPTVPVLPAAFSIAETIQKSGK
ncbi:MAG: MmgE/PrpD family protein, partial [Acidobacteria bacterium]|nr:MmgE/PrpD family protein [Acidobacteriota bacterium]